MNIFTEFKRKLRDHGLEYFGLYYSVYRGTVSDNKDPDVCGRIKVSVPQVYGETIPDTWAFPRGVGMPGKNNGIYLVPNIGDPVYVTFENGNTRFPLYETGWWIKGNKPDNLTSEKKFLIQTPDGRRFELDDEEKKVTLEDSSGFKVVLDSDGVYIGNDTQNLGKFMNDLFTVFEGTTSGPYPFNNLAQYIALGEKIKLFLKDKE